MKTILAAGWFLFYHGIKNFVASAGGRMVHDLEKIKVPHITLPLKTKNPIKLYLNSLKLEKIIKENGINIVHARSRAPAWSAYFPKVGRIEELVKYCEEIACGAPELPFYFYHIPAFNGAFLSMVAFLEAVDGRIPNFAGIKYTFESMYEYNQCRLYKNGKFDMLHGQDETILPCLAMG